MAKSNSQEYVKRINKAVSLLEEKGFQSQAVTSMMQVYSISRRQAYRYIEKAKQIGKQLPIPEKKIVFTVKLSSSTVDRIRRLSRIRYQSVSEIVNEALMDYLEKGNQGGSSTK